MFRFEWKKLLFYRNGLLLILVFLLAELISICLTTEPYDKELEWNRTVYNTYLSQVEGPLTPKNRQWLESEMLRLNTSHIKLEQLKSDYYSGHVSEKDFREEFDVLATENADYPGFSKLYTQYIFVREKDQRCFLYTGGWEVLFGNQNPDYLYMLLLIFLITPIFCQEYGNQMDQILLTQKRSANQQWKIKVGIALLSTVVLTAILQLFELSYCAIRFGLPHWDYSLQSLYSFGNVQKELTLGRAFALQFALKELGYLYATLLLLCVSVVVKRYTFALMAGMVMLPIPFLTVDTNTALLHIPGPWALMLGSIYLNGDGLLNNSWGVELLPEVSWSELGKVVAWVSVICLLLLLCIKHKNANYHVRSKRHKALASMLALILLMTGCGKHSETVCYNSNRASSFESERYVVFLSDLKGTVFVDKQTGEMYDFPMDAFQGITAQIDSNLYYEDGKLYYLKREQQAQKGNSEGLVNHYALIALDITSMEERVIYSWSQSSQWFFGLLDKESAEPSPNQVGAFFLHDGQMFYLYNSELYVMDLKTGKYELFMKLPNASVNLAYDGENLYYTDQYNRLVVHKLSYGTVTPVEKVVAKKFVQTPKGIYFLNIRDNNTLYYWNGETQTVEKLDDTKAYDVYWDVKYCWINSTSGLYRLDHNGGNKIKVDCPGFVCCITAGEGMYMLDYESGELYGVNKDTLEWKGISQ